MFGSLGMSELFIILVILAVVGWAAYYVLRLLQEAAGRR